MEHFERIDPRKVTARSKCNMFFTVRAPPSEAVAPRMLWRSSFRMRDKKMMQNRRMDRCRDQ
jgi:hypothetical protein